MIIYNKIKYLANLIEGLVILFVKLTTKIIDNYRSLLNYSTIKSL